MQELNSFEIDEVSGSIAGAAVAVIAVVVVLIAVGSRRTIKPINGTGQRTNMKK